MSRSTHATQSPRDVPLVRSSRVRFEPLRKALWIALLPLGGLAIAACTSSASTTSTTTSSTTSPATSTSTGAVTTCLPAQLKITPQTGNGAAGTIQQTILLQNTSATACTLGGYPGMQMLAANGSSLPTNVVRGGATFGVNNVPANAPPSTQRLNPQDVAAFILSYSDVPAGTETSCPMSSQVEITPPNDTGFAVVNLQIAPCSGGTIHVSPVYIYASAP
jgi:Protein of unknown function (DUF4232)